MTQHTITYDDATLASLLHDYAATYHDWQEAAHTEQGEVDAAFDKVIAHVHGLLAAAPKPEAVSRMVPSVEEIMTKVQEFASTWPVAGGCFDDGMAMDRAEACREEIRALLERYGQAASGHNTQALDTSSGHSEQSAASAEPAMRVRVVHAGGEVQDPTIEHTSRWFDSLPGDMVLDLYAAPVAAQPIDMILRCPACGTQHIDAPESEWTNPPHRSHLCHNCGHIWRPADVPTNGVAAIKTRGEKDGIPVAAQAQPWQKLAAAMYQAAGAYDMPVQVLDALSAAADGEPFAHLIDGLLPVECPGVGAQDREDERQRVGQAINEFMAQYGEDDDPGHCTLDWCDSDNVDALLDAIDAARAAKERP